MTTITDNIPTEVPQDKHFLSIKNESLQCVLSNGFRHKLPLFDSKDCETFSKSLNQTLQRFFNLL